MNTPHIYHVDLSSHRKNPAFNAACSVVQKLQTAGYSAYIVGGTPRDILLGRVFNDVDVAVNATPEAVELLFPQTHRIGVSFGVILVVENGEPIEVASFRTEGEYLDGRHPSVMNYTDSVAEDSARRDFTINAFYLNPITGEILDFWNGYHDLQKGILRTVGAPKDRFNEDVLRVLRAVRFACRFNFTIDEEMIRVFPKVAHRLKSLSMERVREELNGMLLSRRPSLAIRLLDELDLLPIVLPEVSQLKGCPQSPIFHPEGDVFIHTLLALDHLIAPDLPTLWATLLHDIAKPHTLTFGEDGVPHAYGHEEKGAEVAKEILIRLKFDVDTIDAVTEAIRNHMRFIHIDKMNKAKVRRLLASSHFYIEFQLLYADIMGSHQKIEPWLKTVDAFYVIMNEPQLPEPWIKGRDLIAQGLTPSPLFKRVLTSMMDGQLDGTYSDRASALADLARVIDETEDNIE